MKHIQLAIIFATTLLVSGCWRTNEPSPKDDIDMMSLSAKKVDNTVTLSIEALTFKGSVGFLSTTFEQAEIWIGEENSGTNNMKLAYTTSDKTIRLDNLKPETVYYVSAKGIKKGAKTDFSKPIMFITRSIKPVETLLELSSGFYMKSSTNTPYMAYTDNKTNELVLLNWKDKSKKILYKNTTGKSYLVRGFYSDGNRILLETSRNGERAFEYYDITAQAFGTIEIPATARVWNYAFSPDQTKMAYTDYAKQGLYIYDVNTKENKQFSGDFFYEFDWSNDGTSIIQLRNKPNAVDNTKEIVSYNIADASKNAIHLFEWPNSLQWVSFSPKQDYIMFGSNIANSSDLWIYEIKTKKIWQMSDVGNFGWIGDKEFFVGSLKNDKETTWKVDKYIMP